MTHSFFNDESSIPSSAQKSSPFRRFLQTLTYPVRRLLGKSSVDDQLRETLEELIEDRSSIKAPIDGDERLLLGNVLSLRNSTAQDLMIPRADIIAVHDNMSAQDILGLAGKTGFMRFPIFKDSLDNVIGVVHVKDLLNLPQSEKPLQIKPLIKDVCFISPAMRTLDLLLYMRETGTKMAIVVDEYGGIDGLVTLSDLMEEIVGDIQDAQEAAPPQIHHHNDTIIADGRLDVDEATDYLGINIVPQEHSDDVDTIGGLVTSLAGHVPARGELIKHPFGFDIEVLEADPRRVKKVKFNGFDKLLNK
jgi:CBS domain containing-hemolysin-like protein